MAGEGERLVAESSEMKLSERNKHLLERGLNGFSYAAGDFFGFALLLE